MALALLIPYTLAFVRVRLRPQVHFHPDDPSFVVLDKRPREPQVGAIVLFRNSAGDEAMGEVAFLEGEEIIVVAPGYPSCALQTHCKGKDVIGHIVARLAIP